MEGFDLINYADDNTPYACAENLDKVVNILEKGASSLFKWVSQNYFKANPDKSYLVLSKSDNRIINIESQVIHNSSSRKLLGITIDNKLKFEDHINNLCNKANLKLHALGRIANFMSTHKLKMIMKAFILSQFSYCPLIWMFHSRELNNRINRTHERALRIAYKDSSSSFLELLRKDDAVTIHHRNLQLLAVELYKVVNGLSPKIMEEIFQTKENTHNLRDFVSINERNVKTVHYGQGSISYLSPRIWRLVPDDIKSSPSIHVFKCKIKKWIPEGCPCRLCKQYIANLGFI